MDADLLAFNKRLEGFVEAVKQATTNTLQQIVVEVGTSVVMLSPVLTGRFRGNWQMTVGQPASNTLLTEDPDGAATLAALRQMAATLTPGEVGYIVNNLEYGQNVESLGWTVTPPYAPVRRSLSQFTVIANAAIARNKVDK